MVFVKVHKAASSTVQNILFRFALSRNLTSLLPVTGTLISEREAAIPRENVIPHPRGEGTFDVLGVHVVYDHKEMDKYFPKSAFRVAIIRDPLKQAVSALAYYTVVWPYPQLTSGFNRHPLDPITSFLKHPEDFSGGPGCPELGSWVSNRMSYDLGVGSQASSLETLKRDDAAVQLFLQTLEKQFDLILIADHFEESIVLLRRYLKWSMKDIIFIKVNAMQEGEDSVWRKRPNLTAIDLSAFEQCNKLDYRLYQHFLPVFFEKIHKETLFQQEVDAFREIQRKVSDFCNNGKNHKRLRIPRSFWNEEFLIERCDCLVMGVEESHLVEAVKRRQLRLLEEFKSQHQSAYAAPRNVHLFKKS